MVVAADSVPVSDHSQNLVQQSLFAVASAGPPAPQAPDDSRPIEGTLTVRIQVFVLRRPSQWIEVTRGVQQVVLSIGDPQPATIAQMSLPAGPYRAV